MKNIQSTSFEIKEGEYYLDFKNRLIEVTNVDITTIKGTDVLSFLIEGEDHNGKKVQISTPNPRIFFKKHVKDISEYPEYFV